MSRNREIKRRNHPFFLVVLLTLVFVICMPATKLQAATSKYWNQYSGNQYYKQLSKKEKKVYDKLDQELSKLLTGKENLKVIKSSSVEVGKLAYKSVKISNVKLTKKMADKVFTALEYDKPQYYFVWMMSYVDKHTVTIYVKNYYANGKTRAKQTQNIKKKLDAWSKIAQKQKEPVAQLSYIYQQICSNTVYHTWTKGRKNPTYVTGIDGPLLHGKGVCMAYSSLFMALSNRLGYRCICVGSDLGAGHAWNEVQVNDSWYIVDATWGDQGSDGNIKWFLISQTSAEQLDKNGSHSQKNFTKGFKVPLAQKDYSRIKLLTKEDLLPVTISSQSAYTVSVPELYFNAATKAGRLESIYYDTKDYYTKDGKTYQKKANVYLPYGYDAEPSRRYPILYYMHGTRQSEDSGMRIVNFLDHMIEDGWIEPIIVVFPTFYTNNDAKDMNVGYHNEDAFRYEFRNELMIAVEGKYRTYANGTSESALIASRDYRAFTGLSAGGFISWNTFLDNAQYVKTCIPMAGYLTMMFDDKGIWISHDKMVEKAIAKAQELTSQGISYQIIECCGTQDNQMTTTVEQQFTTLTASPYLSSKGQYQLLWTQGAGHENRAWDEGLFSALPQVFPGEYYKELQSNP